MRAWPDCVEYHWESPSLPIGLRQSQRLKEEYVQQRPRPMFMACVPMARTDAPFLTSYRVVEIWGCTDEHVFYALLGTPGA